MNFISIDNQSVTMKFRYKEAWGYKVTPLKKVKILDLAINGCWTNISALY